jgi:hypothetical protein
MGHSSWDLGFQRKAGRPALIAGENTPRLCALQGTCDGVHKSQVSRQPSAISYQLSAGETRLSHAISFAAVMVLLKDG